MSRLPNIRLIITKRIIGNIRVMKRLSILILLHLCFINIIAQTSSIVGTWEGTITMQIPDSESDGMKDFQSKIVLRITQYGEEYGVRVKNIPIDDPSKVYYWNDCRIIQSDKSEVKWSSHIRTSYDWDSSDRKNGRVIYCADYSWIYSASFYNGRVNLVRYMHTDYKDQNGSLIGTHDNPSEKILLYKQDNDW